MNDIGKSVEVINLNNEKVLAGLHTLLARPFPKTFSRGFCGFLCNSAVIKTQIQKQAQGSKVLSISAKRLSSVSLPVPSFGEQKRISNFLVSIEKKIETEKEILRKYQNQKNYFLQKMFI